LEGKPAGKPNNCLKGMAQKEDLLPVDSRPRGETGRLVRRELVGGGREQLTEVQVQQIKRHIGEILRKMGYMTAAHLSMEHDSESFEKRSVNSL
jgi:hypothetical protein